MPQFDPNVLRVDAIRERWERADDVVCFADLVLRWPYHAIINIAHELHADIYDVRIDGDDPPLVLYLCDDVVIGAEGQKILRLRPIHINTPFNPFLSNIHSLVVLRRVVERLEAQHPNYAGKRPLKNEESGLLLATQDNLKEICIYILQAWHQASLNKEKIKAAGYDLTSGFWAEVRTSVERLLPLTPELIAQSFISAKNTLLSPSPPDMQGLNTSNATEYKNKEDVQRFIQRNKFSLKTNAERLIALEAIFDAGFPRLENEDFGKLLWPDRVLDSKTYKSYGSRLCRDLRKIKGKQW